MNFCQEGNMLTKDSIIKIIFRFWKEKFKVRETKALNYRIFFLKIISIKIRKNSMCLLNKTKSTKMNSLTNKDLISFSNTLFKMGKLEAKTKF